MAKGDQAFVSGKHVELSAAEVSIVFSALATQRAVWLRAANKEIPGSDIHTMRLKQVEECQALMNRYSFGGS